MQAVLWGTILFAAITVLALAMIALYMHAPPVCCAHEDDR